MNYHRKGYVYILSNYTRTVLYVGVTNNLVRRCGEHVNKRNSGFTSQYHVYYLIYYEEFESIVDAIKREKRIKAFTRIKKEELIASFNPQKINLFVSNKICSPPKLDKNPTP